MGATTADMLKTLAQSRRGFTVTDIQTLREDLRAMSPADLATAYAGAQRSAAAKRADEADPATAIHQARRKLLIATDRFIGLILERVEAEDGVSLDHVPKRTRASVPALLRAADEDPALSPERLAAAATAIAAERSLAYDMA